MVVQSSTVQMLNLVIEPRVFHWNDSNRFSHVYRLEQNEAIERRSRSAAIERLERFERSRVTWPDPTHPLESDLEL